MDTSALRNYITHRWRPLRSDDAPCEFTDRLETLADALDLVGRLVCDSYHGRAAQAIDAATQDFDFEAAAKAIREEAGIWQDQLDREIAA